MTESSQSKHAPVSVEVRNSTEPPADRRGLGPNSAAFPREDVCPPWCSGHSGRGYNDWQEWWDGSPRRNHPNRGETVMHITVGINQEELADGSTTEAIVEVFHDGADDHDSDMTPDQAADLAAAILRAVATIQEAGQ